MVLLVRIALGVLVLAAICLGVGLALPRNHRATSRITLSGPPAAVWAVVRDPSALLGTWKELEAARRLPDEGGKEVWEQKAGGFAMKILIEEAAEPARLVTRVDAGPKAPFGGVWTYELAPAGGGTQLTVTEDGYVTNPLFRVVMHLTGLHRTLDAFESALAAKLGESAVPVHLKE